MKKKGKCGKHSYSGESICQTRKRKRNGWINHSRDGEERRKMHDDPRALALLLYICRMWRSRSSTVAGRGWRRRRRIRWPTWRSKLWVIWLHHQLYNTRTRSIICILGSWGEKKKQFGPRKERLGIIGMDVIGKNQSQIWFRFHFFLYASIPTTPTSSCFLCPCLYILIYANHASCICCGVYIYMHGSTNLLAPIYKRVHPTTICSFLTLANPTLI